MDAANHHLRRALLLVLAIATTLVAPAAADASSATVSKGKLTYTALTGEANVLTASYPSAGVVTLTDNGHMGAMPIWIYPGSGCTGAGQTITCSGVTDLTLNTGDGADDVVDSSAVPLPTQVTTGNGNDRVLTGAGNDNINTHDGNDVLDGGLGSDVYTGGPGTGDVASYASHSASQPVIATLDGLQNDGCAACGENDRISADVEGLTGGAGSDTLTGGPGNDTIDGGPGADVQNGGPGNDTLVARDGSVDRLDCGDGSDGGSADNYDTIGSNCESVALAAYDPGTGTNPAGPPATTNALANLAPPTIPVQTAVVTAKGVALVRVVCPPDAGACKGSIDIVVADGTAPANNKVAAARRRKMTRIGHGKFVAKAGAKPIVHVRLNRRGRQRILRARHTHCRVVVTTRSATGKVVTTTQSITLRPRRGAGRAIKKR
jgi:hypothetical protein